MTQSLQSNLNAQLMKINGDLYLELSKVDRKRYESIFDDIRAALDVIDGNNDIDARSYIENMMLQYEVTIAYLKEDINDCQMELRNDHQ